MRVAPRSLLSLLFLSLTVAGCSPAPAPSLLDGGVADQTPLAGDATTAPPVDLVSTDPSLAVVRVHYPAGSHTLSLRGASGPWNWQTGVAMTAATDDTWTYSTRDLTGPTEWKPLLDDSTWSRGPNYTVAPGQTVDIYPHFTSTKGKVVQLIAGFHSNHLARNRNIWAYLPASYDENTRATYPVVYMHDGQNLFDPTKAFGGNEWKVDETMDAAEGDASIREAIVIGVDNTSDRIYELTPTMDGQYGGGGASLYLKMIAEEIKPKVDQMLRTRPGRADTAIAGSSLGGLVSAYAGVHNADTFGLVAALSPSTWWDNTFILTDVKTTPQSPRPLRVYVDSGDSGNSSDDVANTKKLAQAYRDLGYSDGKDLRHVVQMGGTHSEVYWAQRLPGALAFLLGPR